MKKGAGEPWKRKGSVKNVAAKARPARRGNDNRLKIIIVHQGMTRAVLPLLNSRHDVVGIIESVSAKESPGVLLKLAKMVHAAARPNGITLQTLSRAYGIPYYRMTDGSAGDLAGWVKKLAPDVIAIHTMARLLKPEIFSLPRLGAINLHQSYLPAYRGPNPDFWQYHDMEMNPGVTVHFIDSGEDTGDIIFQDRVPIPLGTKSPERLDKLVGEAGAALLLKALDALADSSAPRIPQPPASPTSRARKISAGEHRNIIDWDTWEIERIWHLLRGTEQWFNAIDGLDGLYKGQRWRIDEFIKCDMAGYRASTIHYENGRHFVACNGGKIYLSKTFSVKRFVSRLLRK
jgi:methionyl-tRNA formyltransferase